jgi:hypothetical protein
MEECKMKNLLNIEDEVKVIMPGYVSDGYIAKVSQIDLLSGEIYYIGTYHYNCPDGGEGYDMSVQFKEGQYEHINSEIYELAEDKKVRCKFKCTNKTILEEGLSRITMEPVYCGSKENKEFFKYTPCRKLEIGTINAEASKQFETGKEYYIDIIQA